MEDYVRSYMERTPGSASLYARAAAVMPGGVSHGMRFFAPYPVFTNRAQGGYIWDIDGNKYIDLWMGHYTHILGHRPAPVMAKLLEVVQGGAHWGIVNPYEVDFAETLCRLIPGAERVRFGVSGTEAAMYAVRLARAYTGRRTILKVKGGWHGSGTDLLLAVHSPMDVPESAGLPPGVMEHTHTISYNDLEGTAAAINYYGPDLAGVIMEGVGQLFIPPEDNYLQMVREETRRVGALLILDEVITGFRLGLAGAQGRYGILPDLTTLGKVTGGGMNISVVAGRKEILDMANPTIDMPKGEGVSMGGGTFSCMTTSMVAGLAMVSYLNEHAEEVYPALESKGEKVRHGVEAAFRAQGITARCLGVGSLFTTCFPRAADTKLRNVEDVEINTDIRRRDEEFRLRMLNKGIYTVYGGGALSMAHTDNDIERITAAAAEVAAEMAVQGSD